MLQQRTRVLHYSTRDHRDVVAATVFLTAALRSERELRYEWSTIPATPPSYQLTIYTKTEHLPDNWLSRLDMFLTAGQRGTSTTSITKATEPTLEQMQDWTEPW